MSTLIRTDEVPAAEALNRVHVEARAGCHCATLAHHAFRLNPPASCRLSFYLYNTLDEVDAAVAAVAAAGADDARAARWYRFRHRDLARERAPVAALPS